MTAIAQPVSAATPLEHDLGSRGEVVVDTLDTEIRLRGVEGTVARIRLAAGTLEEEFRVETGPGRLSIQPIRRWSFVRRRDVGPLELEIPRDAVVRAGSASGSVLGLDLTAGGRFRSASGDIDLAGVGGSVDAESMSGGVRVRTAESIVLRLRTVSGRIDGVAPAATRIEAKTVSGSVRISGRLAGDGPFSFESVSGDVVIGTDGAIRLMASTVSGQVHSELPQVVDVGRRRTLAFGGSGPLVSARSVSGDIRLVAATTEVEAAPATVIGVASSTPIGTAPEPASRPEPPEPVEPTEVGQESQSPRRPRPRIAAWSSSARSSAARSTWPRPGGAWRPWRPIMPESLETVLRLVEEGRLTAEEAASILAALDEVREPAGGPSDEAGPRPADDAAGPGRIVRVEVTDNGRVVVNLKLPASLGELAMARIPGLGEADLSRIREALLSGLRGDLMHVVDEDGTGVRIAVE